MYWSLQHLPAISVMLDLGFGFAYVGHVQRKVKLFISDAPVYPVARIQSSTDLNLFG
jgi:hypothetical protein